jgi:hypothetical protein
MRLRVILPIVIVVLLVFAVVGTVISNNVTAGVVQQTEAEMTRALNSTKSQLERAEAEVAKNQASQSSTRLTLARAIATLLNGKPELLDSDQLSAQAQSFGVDEINVTDANGVIRWSNLPGRFGTNLADDPQMQPFLPILKDSSYELAQMPQKRGKDDLIYQYVGVSRSDATGIIQLGFVIDEDDPTAGYFDPQDEVEGKMVGLRGGVFVVDGNKNVIADSARLYLDSNIADQPWANLLGTAQLATFEFEFGGTPVMAKCLMFPDDSQYFKDTIIVAYVPVADVESYRVSPILTLGIIGGLGLILLIFLVFFLINRVVLKPLDNITAQVEELGSGGRIDIEALKRNTEFAFIGHAFNEMLDRAEGFGGDTLEDFNVETNEPATLAETPDFAVTSEPVIMPEPATTPAPLAVPEPLAVPGSLPVPEPLAVPVPALAPESTPAPIPVVAPISAGMQPITPQFASEPPAQPIAVDFLLDQMFHRIVALIRPQLQQKALSFSVLLDKAVPNQLFGTEQQLSEVLMDMFADAIAVVPENGLIECITKLIDVKQGIYNVRIIVHCSVESYGYGGSASLVFQARESDPDDLLQDL